MMGEARVTTQAACIPQLLRIQADRRPDAIAIAAPGRPPLTFGRLRRHLEDVVEALNAMGVGRNDRVALVLPNGPEMAAAFLGVSSCATAAPLNPEYAADEFDAYLSDLGAMALIIQAGMESAARAVAQARGIPLIDLFPLPDAAGLFRLTGESRPSTAHGGSAQPDDVALVLSTSGSTGRPKRIPLTHANLCATAHAYQQPLELVEADRCLNVMPLFHYHGLIGASLPSFLAGGSVVYTTGFEASRFFEWMDVFRPTWYTASPTVHQAILARAPRHRDIIARCPLRFIRSSSAPLPWKVMMELEHVFQAPVINVYGMTEAAPITVTPFPPRPRKQGSVGVAVGSKVAIMGQDGRLFPRGETGEVVVRGPEVMEGYDDDPAANEAAFANGWFRTGEQGFMDHDGYLFITGRLKDVINRGGEKVSPEEVADVLLTHPAVAQCAILPVPDTRLGEEVAAVAVLKQGAAATEKDIQEFLAQRLAAFKVPRRLVFVSEIPHNAVGKLARIGLAEQLGLSGPGAAQPKPKPVFVPPQTDLEQALARIWTELLGVEGVGVHDNFLDLGGDSLLATRVITRIKESLGVELSVISFFQAPTVAAMAAVIAERQAGRAPAGEVAQVLAELDGLSEEEAERTLADETGWITDRHGHGRRDA